MFKYWKLSLAVTILTIPFGCAIIFVAIREVVRHAFYKNIPIDSYKLV